MLGDVRQRLARDEVGRGLDRGREPLRRRVDRDAHRRAGRQRLEGGGEPALAQKHRMDAAGELAQVLDRALDPDRRVLEYVVDVRVDALREPPPLAGELDAERDELLLQAVVEIAFDAAPLFVGRRDDAGARFLHLLELRA